MTKVFADNEWFRKSFSSHESIINTPPLMNLQIQSYEEFMQKDVPHSNRKNIGLHAVFQSVFPIMDFNKTVSLEYVSYSFEPPKYSLKECRERVYPMKLLLKLLLDCVF